MDPERERGEKPVNKTGGSGQMGVVHLKGKVTTVSIQSGTYTISSHHWCLHNKTLSCSPWETAAGPAHSNIIWGVQAGEPWKSQAREHCSSHKGHPKLPVR